MNRKNKINRIDTLKSLKKVKIKTLGFNAGYIIMLIGLLIISISLLVPWFSLQYNNNSYGAFSNVVGIIGIVSVLLIIFNIFIIFSTHLKQKIKLQLNSSWKDSSIFFFSSITLLILGIQGFVGLTGLKVFSSVIIFHSGITFFLIGSILFISGAIVNKSISKDFGETYITNNADTNSTPNQLNEKNTTKLPF